MPQNWDPPPYFALGQPLSAGGHLNALGRCLQTLHDDWLGSQMAFQASDSAAIRHKANRLDWSYEISGSGTTWIIYNGVEVPGTRQTGAGVHAGTADLAGLGLTVGAFYIVTIGGSGAKLWLLREVIAPSYPALAAFADGDTPTAAQWQALSDTATGLNGQMSHPIPAMARTTRTLGEIFVGTMQHHCRYLRYELVLKNCYNTTENGRWTMAELSIDGNVYHVWRVGDEWENPPAYVEPVTAGAGGEQNFNGSLDLDPLGIASGADYTLSLSISRSAGPIEDLYGSGVLLALAEIPAEAPEIDGWQALPTWAHGDYAYGSSTSKKIQTLKSNLALMAGQTLYHNYPCPIQIAGTNWRFYMRRRYRWLHYKNDEHESPKIAYVVGGNLSEVNLPDASTQWQVYDLDQARYCWPGTEYLVAGMTYAIEDVEA